MRNLLVKHLMILCLLMHGLSLYGQDAVFSQFYAAPILLNPAFVGTSRAPSIALNHRSQYVGFASAVPYQTYAVSYGQYLAPIRSGIGLSVLADNAGSGNYQSYAGYAYYSYNIQIDRDNTIRVGLSAGVQHRQLDWDQLLFPDQANPITGFVDQAGNPIPTSEVRPGDPTKTFADFGTGILYAGKVAYAGISLDHVTTPDDRVASIGPGGFYKGLPMRLSVHAGAQLNFGPSRGASPAAFLTPNVLYTRQGPFEQLNLGAYIGAGQFFGGAWFRHAFGNPDAVIGVVGLEWDMYKFGYSYDYAVSALSPVTTGTHEISLQINFDKAWWVKERREAERYNDCLQLFR